MNRSVDLAVWAALAAAAVALQVLAVAGAVPSVAEAISFLMRRPVGRWAVLLGWLWLGWHVFVR
jgi:hypothetical protein